MHDPDPNLRDCLPVPDENFQSPLELHDLRLGYPRQEVCVVDPTGDGFIGLLERNLASADPVWEPDPALAHKLDSDIEDQDLSVVGDYHKGRIFAGVARFCGAHDKQRETGAAGFMTGAEDGRRA